MPIFDLGKMRPIDIKLLKATGVKFVPVNKDNTKLIVSLNGRSYFAIPK